jgi:hypothetical protein
MKNTVSKKSKDHRQGRRRTTGRGNAVAKVRGTSASSWDKPKAPKEIQSEEIYSRAAT